MTPPQVSACSRCSRFSKTLSWRHTSSPWLLLLLLNSPPMVPWSHPVSGHTLVTPCQWSHTGVVTLSVGQCCAMVVPGDTRQHCPWPPARVGVVTTGRPPDTPTPGPQPRARRSMSVDLWTLFLLSPHFIEQIKSQHYCHCRIECNETFQR